MFLFFIILLLTYVKSVWVNHNVNIGFVFITQVEITNLCSVNKHKNNIYIHLTNDKAHTYFVI